MLSRTGRAAMRRQGKDVWILRHGQALHNPRAEKARAEGCSHETFMELMRQDDSLDSALTDLGRQEAASVCKIFENQQQPPDVVVSSPLSRALETADLALSAEIQPNRVAYEGFREINGWLKNAQRRTMSDLRQRFPDWSFDESMTEKDELWTETLEETDICGE